MYGNTHVVVEPAGYKMSTCRYVRRGHRPDTPLAREISLAKGVLWSVAQVESGETFY